MIRQWRRAMTVATEAEYQLNKQPFKKFTTLKKLNQESSAGEQKVYERISKFSSGSRKLMRSWELHSYGGPSDLQLTTAARVPVIRNPKDVIVNVKASSVNPIDVLMTSGYGAGTINILRQLDSKSFCEQPSLLSALKLTTEGTVIEFPLTLGRDFAGVVAEVGADVTDFRIGDEVFGAVGVQRNGSHADFVVVSADMVRKKPPAFNFIEAAALPYVALTTWSAIHITGNYCNLNGKKFLILGGSGGVGTFAIQYLRASGAYVVSTCSTDAVGLLSELGCSFAVDYKDNEHMSYISQQAPFDCILDLSGKSKRPELLKFLTPTSGQYITLSPPFLSNSDKFGFFRGMLANINSLALDNMKSLQSDKVLTKWAFFVPCGQGMDRLTSLAESGKVKAAIQEVFKFEDLPKAYEKLAAGHSRGKIVIDFA